MRADLRLRSQRFSSVSGTSGAHGGLMCPRCAPARSVLALSFNQSTSSSSLSPSSSLRLVPWRLRRPSWWSSQLFFFAGAFFGADGGAAASAVRSTTDRLRRSCWGGRRRPPSRCPTERHQGGTGTVGPPRFELNCTLNPPSASPAHNVGAGRPVVPFPAYRRGLGTYTGIKSHVTLGCSPVP